MRKYIIILLGVCILIAGIFCLVLLTHKSPSVQEPLHEEQLLKLDTQELAAVLPAELAAVIANLNGERNKVGTLENRLDIANIFIQTAIEFKYSKTPASDEEPQIKKDTLELKKIFFNIIQRRVENEKLQMDYFQAENQRWRKQLPLHRNNLTFRSVRGKRPFSYRKIECPLTLWNSKEKKMVCYKYLYRSGEKSIFYFLDNVLYERDDFNKDALQARYLFFIPPFYNETRSELLEPVLAGRVSVAHLYKGDALPAQELKFESDGVVGGKLVRDAGEKTIKNWTYSSDHRFYSFTRSQFNDLNEGKATYQLYVQIVWPVQPRRYVLQESKNGQVYQRYGTWKEDDKGATVLDMGIAFPLATSEPRAPVYCTLYPNGCKKK